MLSTPSADVALDGCPGGGGGVQEGRTGKDRTVLFGDEALLAFAADHAGIPSQAVIQSLTGLLHSFGDGLDDDTALLALGVPALSPQTTNPRWAR